MAQATNFVSDTEEDIQIYEKTLKIVVLGDGSSGKTTLILRYVGEPFMADYHQTMGIDFFKKRVLIQENTEAVVHIWDIGGQTLGGTMLDKYIFGTQAVLFVYDITNHASFENLEDWVLRVKNVVVSEGMPQPHMALVGNKIDLQHVSVVKRYEHEKFAQDHGMSHYFISAKTGESVNQCFLRIISTILGFRITIKEWEKHRAIIKANLESCSQQKPRPEPRSLLAVRADPRFGNKSNANGIVVGAPTSTTCSIL